MFSLSSYKLLVNSQTRGSRARALLPAVGGAVIGDGPGGAGVASDDCRKKTTVLILANDFDLLSVATEVTDGKRLTGRDGAAAQLIGAPIVNVHVR